MKRKDKTKLETKESFTKSKGPKGSKPKYESVKEVRCKDFTSANDFTWYYQNPTVANDSARINFTSILGGIDQVTYTPGASEQSEIQSDITMPGVMSIYYHTSVGKSNSANSNINIASRLLYTYVRHANSGSRNYEAPDLMTYLLAVGQGYAFYAELIRLYGLLNTTSILNRYSNKVMVQVCGYDYTDLVNKMASLRYYINQFAVKLNTFAIPKNMYLFDRMTFLPLHVFKDGEGAKTQQYIFKPRGYYYWDGTHAQGSCLRFKSYHTISSLKRLDDIISFGDELINALLENEDIGLMSGDILKAFGEANLRKIGVVEDTYATTPIRDEGVLLQIHNMVTSGVKAEFDGSTESTDNVFDITQQDGHLMFDPTIDGSNFYVPGSIDKRLYDTWVESPSPEMIMEMTRLNTFCGVSARTGGASGLFQIETAGTEFLWYSTISVLSGNSVTENIIPQYVTMTLSGPNLAKLNKFDWAFQMYPVGSSSGDLSIPSGDTQNYTWLNAATIDKVNNAALQSLFNVYGLYIKPE